MRNDRDIYISVDVETSGPIPSEYSLLSVGACSVFEPDESFSCLLKPVNQNHDPKAMEICGYSLEEFAQMGMEPAEAMAAFAEWIKQIVEPASHPVFVGFNAPFDWSFVNYYFHHYLDHNPFGFSALDIKALYMGATGCNWQGTRSSAMDKMLNPKLTGTHDALQDAQYQAELFRAIHSRIMEQSDG